jgi:hypothetical protein
MDSSINIKPAKSKGDKWELRLIQNVWVIMSVVLSFLFVIGLVAFLWEKDKFAFDSPIDSDSWGLFGEYIGGILGTIITFFSVYLLIKTLRFQIKSNDEINSNNKRNTEIYVLQQFHDTFTTLVSLYQNSIEAFKIDDEQKGKKFFHEQVKKLQSGFNSSAENYEKQVRQTIDSFNSFYTQFREYAAVYFRLLYRVFQLIDSSEISECKKAEYAKIVRCQLSEDEMFLLRYNAMTTNGKKMQIYINRYNLLKHFPIMSLLEFTIWRKKISEIEKNYIDSFFVDIRKRMMSALLSQSDTDKKFKQEMEDKKYCVKIEISKDNTSAKLEIIKNKKVNAVTDTLSLVLDKFTEKEILELIDAFIQEVYIFSNFSVYASVLEMKIEKDINKAVGQKQDTFWVTIKNKGNYPLILSQRQLDTPRQS